MKKHYFVAQRRTNDGKLYAVLLEATSAANLADPTLVTLNVFDTKKHAEAVRDFWNKNLNNVSFINKNGTGINTESVTYLMNKVINIANEM